MKKNFIYFGYLALIFSLLSANFASPKMTKRHRNSVYKYQLKIPQGWKSVPIQPYDIYTVDKFQSTIRESGFLSKLDIYVFDTKKVALNASIPTGSKEELKEKYRFTCFDHLLEENLDRIKARVEKRYEIKWLHGKYKCAQVYEIAFSGQAKGIVELVCAYQTGNIEFAVKYQFPAHTIEEDRDAYLKSFKTFYLNAQGKEKKDKDLLELPDEEYIKKIEKALPRDWRRKNTKNYVIFTNVKSDKFVRDIAKHLELIRKKYEELFPPKKEITAISIVRLCASRDEYLGYGGPPGSAGYFNPLTKEMVIYDNGTENILKGKTLNPKINEKQKRNIIDNSRQNTKATLYHECFHQYTYYSFGQFSPHSWYGEGLGDYFAGAVLIKREFVIKKFKWRTNIIKKAVRYKRHYPIKTFVRMSKGAYYMNPAVCYAQGWAFIYFLKNTKNPRWQKIIQTYIDTILKTKNKEVAVEKAFEGINYSELDAAFVSFVKANFEIR